MKNGADVRDSVLCNVQPQRRSQHYMKGMRESAEEEKEGGKVDLTVCTKS